MGWYCARGAGAVRGKRVEEDEGGKREETRWARENERAHSAGYGTGGIRGYGWTSGWMGGWAARGSGRRVVCVPEKNPYNPIGTMYSCEFARLSGCSRVFGH